MGKRKPWCFFLIRLLFAHHANGSLSICWRRNKWMFSVCKRTKRIIRTLRTKRTCPFMTKLHISEGRDRVRNEEMVVHCWTASTLNFLAPLKQYSMARLQLMNQRTMGQGDSFQWKKKGPLGLTTETKTTTHLHCRERKAGMNSLELVRNCPFNTLFIHLCTHT